MLETLAVSSGTAGELASTLPTLPGAKQAAMVAEAQPGIRFTVPALAQVKVVPALAHSLLCAIDRGLVADRSAVARKLGSRTPG